MRGFEPLPVVGFLCLTMGLVLMVIMTQTLICSSCGYTGPSVAKIKGSPILELFIWLFFILPGLIYSIWRGSTKNKVCPVCGNTNMIPIDTPIGKKLLQDQGKTLEQVKEEIKAKSPSPKRQAIRAIIIIAISIFIWIVVYNL